MADDQYKLVVGVYLKDQTVAGVKDFQKAMERVSADAKKLQEQLDKTGLGQVEKLTSAESAQRKLIELAKQEADLRVKMALTTDQEAKTRLATQLKSIDLVQAQVSARKSELVLAERIADQQLKGQRQWEAEQKKISAQAQADADKLAAINQRNVDKLAAQQQRNQIDAQKRAQRASSAREAFGIGMGMFVAPAIAGAGLGFLKEGIAGASDMQLSLKTMQIATRASQSDVSNYEDMAYQIASNTAQSAPQSARLMAIIAGSGINHAKDLLNLAPAIANFADVQYKKKGVAFEETATEGVQIAHLFNAFTPDKIKTVLDQVTAISYMMPDKLNRYLTQASYYIPTFNRYGVDSEQAVAAGAFLDRMGLGRGKGGTGLQNFITSQEHSLSLTSHAQQGKKKALDDLGLLNPDGSSKFYKDGKFDLAASLDQVNASIIEQTKKLTGHAKDVEMSKLLTDIQNAFGITGGRVGFLATPQATAMLADIRNRMHDPNMTVAASQRSYVGGTLGGQYSRFTGDIGSLSSALTAPWIPALTSMFSNLALATERAIGWLRKYPDVAKIIGAGILAVSTAAGTFATIYGVGLVGSFVTMGKTADAAAAAMIRAAGAMEGMATASGAAATESGVAAAAIGTGARVGGATLVGALSELMLPITAMVGVLSGLNYIGKQINDQNQPHGHDTARRGAGYRNPGRSARSMEVSPYAIGGRDAARYRSQHGGHDPEQHAFINNGPINIRVDGSKDTKSTVHAIASALGPAIRQAASGARGTALQTQYAHTA